MKKTTVAFYGGVNEVGGNKILLKDIDTRILFDFGMSFTLRNHYYSVPFLSPKDEKGLLEFGILPELKGLYSFDSTEPKVDAVFLSHSHMDHAAYISLLKREIPIYCGETTATILDALSRVRLSGFEFNLSGIKFKTFRTGDKIKIGSLEIEPMHVDHSVPGSYGFVIHTSAGALVYTGDFRRHGSKPSLTMEFLEKCTNEKPKVVISENTNMTGVEVSSEREVIEKLNSVVGHTSGLVMANFACADVDRLNSFYDVAVKNNRSLMVTLKQAYLLQKLSQDPHLNIPKLNDDNILIFQKAKKKYYQWEQETMNLGKIVDSQDVAEKQDKAILVTSFCDLAELVEIKPSSGSCYVLSSSEPFNEEM
ncbi:MAG: MBL fold metallo-hydrolase, partial [Candidatus Bathyarchaeia archaeon]